MKLLRASPSYARITSVVLAALIHVMPLPASADSHQSLEDLNSWIGRERQVAQEKVLANISRSDARRGSVVASPSKQDPNYYFHWVRDASIVMDTVMGLSENTQQKSRSSQLLFDFVDFSRENQQANTLSGLGEPKFYVDGTPFSDPWGRPQNDGPALRAIALIGFANSQLAQGNERYVRERLYDGLIPTHSVIKADLEYVSHHWKDASFDLWEEVLADHFYTRMVQRRALIEGARLARRLGDQGAADWYESQAKALQNELNRHIDPSKGFIVASLNRKGGLDYKSSGLDAAVILGVLHGYAGDGYLSFTNSWVMATFERLVEEFKRIYPINQRAEFAGVAIGRYPEDTYAGDHFGLGNPWPLITLGFAEFCYRAAAEAQHAKGRGEISRLGQGLKERGDSFMERVRAHAFPDGSLSEQIHRDNGFMTSARDLTWGYVSFLTAERARAHLR